MTILATRWSKACHVVFFTLITTIGFSQKITVSAGFVTDSTRVGDDVQFYLTARYPKDQQVVFPDSSFSFTPFELHRKDYFPTKTKDSTSYDSAVYSLRTFEIEKGQSLRLPIFVVNALDCTRVYSNRDTVTIKNLIEQYPDRLTGDLPLKANTAYQHVPLEVNVPLIAIAASFLILIAGVGWVVFGPTLSRHYRIRRLQKQHQAFTTTYGNYLTSIQNSFSPTQTEAAVVAWKNYMEEINRKPYTKLTSKETTLLEKDEGLGHTLRSVDSAIYGSNTQVMDSLVSLKTYADMRFNHIITEVKNG